ncbi:protein of unknown function [Candidatus Nitrosocosmicus franklandus]|uniref:Uncharacterized protein n=1 Tax=Candidatus Nitrosocosmicus franklandianus TaxID=1798806 RepID=A0A484I773_9ARCH|nr:protein of unknown function [Candidatus Nitrosocosmicus franklandus]
MRTDRHYEIEYKEGFMLSYRHSIYLIYKKYLVVFVILI